MLRRVNGVGEDGKPKKTGLLDKCMDKAITGEKAA